ncbi:hypothetical protein BDN72DRAFT_907071 [Pluteus cervinus]|uniref:Uncharacterized protein n=1 Tax=Pluteus cervinus TaxID=181527 RepID=A0ACD2ZXR9_9AGAR|nr:hypothetical protein BDN72DRAFT_907071 [Pluteus cervinus]
MPKTVKTKSAAVPGPSTTPPKSKSLWKWALDNKTKVLRTIGENYDLSALFATAVGRDGEAWAMDAAKELVRVYGVQDLVGENEIAHWKSNFTRGVGSWIPTAKHPVAALLFDANTARVAINASESRARKQLARDLGFTGPGSEGEGEFEIIEVEHLEPAKFYPYTGWFVSETEEARAMWQEHLDKDWWHDRRNDKRFAWPLDQGMLKLNIPVDKSCILVDKTT